MDKYNIQTLNKISPLGTDYFDKEKYTVGDDINNPTGVLVRSASMLETEFNPEMLAIARAGAGVNNIPIDRASEAGIAVFNTPGANANAVKELVVLGLLMSSRKVPDALEFAKTLKGKGSEVGKLVEKGKSEFTGPEIKGKTLGIIGLGAIGALVANVAIHLGMNVIGTDPFMSVGSALRLSPHVKVTASRDDIYKEADYISIHVPFNNDTKGFINADSISKMKDGVRILNFARGELVNDSDIIAAIGANKVFAYVTDFPNENTLGIPGIIAIPHLGASTPESEDNCAVMAALELIDYIEFGNIKNSVNLPDAEMFPVGTKVCVIHKNIPAVISAITSEFAKLHLNIENMLNKSKKDYAYSCFDITGGDITDDIVDNISKITGVIRVRVI
ncbi:MAG: 3-phosphoglycerate dehydrogenase [Ruminococcus sp.]|jgi:D-3-phosphoglycerate dehydrogenase|nr:3-phosphoglycerate dehydrogenase [Ruminococcus sp.]